MDLGVCLTPAFGSGAEPVSEYQYYEFQAVDRPLSKQEMTELRKVSTRAKITPNRFVNVYNYGDFGGSSSELMDKYFDAFVYVANWGAHEFMLRLPQTLLDPELVEPYTTSDRLTARTVDDFVVLEFVYFDEGGEGYWITDEEAASWLLALLPIREELARGDLRCLYLGWLSCAPYWLDDDEVEPPVPPGLGKLSPALRTFAEFLWIDEALIEIAAERSMDLDAFEPTQAELQRWIRDLPEDEKDDLLLRVATGDDTRVQAGLLRRFQTSTQTITDPTTGGRTVGELLAAAEQRAELKQRETDEREAREQARQAEEQAKTRAAYLDDLATRQDGAWSQVKSLIEAKRAKEYDEAVQLLKDLHDLAIRNDQAPQFNARLHAIREQHAKKRTLLSRLQKAGL